MDFNASKLNIWLKFCMFCYHDKNWREHKTKTEYTLWIALEGNIHIKYGKKEYSLKKNDIALFYPGQTYSAWNKESDCRFLVIFFSIETDSVQSSLEQVHMAGVYKDTRLEKGIRDLIRVAKEYPVSNTGFDLQMHISFLTLFRKLMECRDTASGFETDTNKDIDVYDNNRKRALKLNHLIKKIENNPEQDYSITSMADFMEMSEKYFISYFHLHTSKTPKQFVVDCRMNKAAKLLENPHMTLAEIAQLLQYSDMYAFSKAFKKYYNESPSNFRKSYYSDF